MTTEGKTEGRENALKREPKELWYSLSTIWRNGPDGIGWSPDYYWQMKQSKCRLFELFSTASVEPLLSHSVLLTVPNWICDIFYWYSPKSFLFLHMGSGMTKWIKSPLLNHIIWSLVPCSHCVALVFCVAVIHTYKGELAMRQYNSIHKYYLLKLSYQANLGEWVM